MKKTNTEQPHNDSHSITGKEATKNETPENSFPDKKGDKRENHKKSPARIVGIFLLCLFLLPTLLSLLAVGLFYIPGVQDFAIRKIEDIINKEGNIHLSIGDLRISYPLKLKADDILILTAKGDTLASIDKIKTSVSPLSLIDGYVRSNDLLIEDLLFHYANDKGNMSMGAKAHTIHIAPLAVNLKKSHVQVGALLLDQGYFHLFSSDTTKKKEAEKPLTWQIKADRVDINDFTYDMQMPFNRLYVHVHAKELNADRFAIGLDSMRITADHLALDSHKVWYAQDDTIPTGNKLDFTHLYGDALQLKAHNVLNQASTLIADVESLSLKERCGAEISHFQGKYKMENSVISVQQFGLTTPQSRLEGDVYLPLTIFSGDSISEASLKAKGFLSKDDIYYFSGIDIADFITPKGLDTPKPVTLNIDAIGSLQKINLKRLQLESEGILRVEADGKALYPLNNNKRAIQFNTEAIAWQGLADLIGHFTPSMKGRLVVPDATSFTAQGKAEGPQLNIEALLSTSRHGTVDIQGDYNLSKEAYNLSMETKDFDVEAFLPKDSIGVVNASINGRGRKFDFLSPTTEANLNIDLRSIQYKGRMIEGLTLTGLLSGGDLQAVLDSHAENAKLHMNIEGRIKDKVLSGHLYSLADSLNFSALGLSQDTLVVALQLHSDFNSDFSENHFLDLRSQDIFVQTGSKRYRVDSLQCTLQTDKEQIKGKLISGDLNLSLLLAEGLKDINARTAQLTRLIQACIKDSVASPVTDIARLLPVTQIELQMGTRNPAAVLLAQQRMSIQRLQLSLKTDDTTEQIDLQAEATGMRKDTLRINSARLHLYTRNLEDGLNLQREVQRIEPYFVWSGSAPHPVVVDSLHSSPKVLQIDAFVDKQPTMKQQPFAISLQATSDLRAIDLNALYKSNDTIKYKAGLLAFRNNKGFGLSINPNPIIIEGKQLRPNNDNALYVDTTENSIKASLELLTDLDGTIALQSKKDTEENIDYINLNIKNFQLSVLNGLFGIDKLGGLTFADIHFERERSTLIPSVVGDISINNFQYNEANLGNISTALFYQPAEHNSHYINAQISHNGNLNFALEGKYNSQNSDSPIDAKANINDFPLQLANPILGKDVATLSGFLKGDLTVTGSPKNLLVNGTITPMETMAYVPLVGETFELKTEPLRFLDDHINIENLCFAVAGDNISPLCVNGDFYLFGKKALTTDLHIKGKEIQLLDSKRSKGQILYGKIIASSDLSVRGKVSKPVIRGNVSLHGGTNATYVYTGNKLKAQDNMAGVITFTDFRDSLLNKEKENVLLPTGGADISVNVHLDPSVRLGVDLDAGHQDYVEVQGGGDLHLSIPPFSDMNLVGNYEIQGGGKIRYNFPVVGRKIFDIDPSSRIIWNGPVTSPSIAFKAINKVRAEVVENKQSRKVDFDVIIRLEEAEDKYNLIFDLEAPDDLSLQNRLASMSTEERGKQAIALMVTGTFLSGDASEANMEKILSNLAVKELNDLTGKLLEGTDINIGMELQNGINGGSYTDYTYSFSKRFYDDRIRIVFGGRVSTGNLPTNHEQTFIDNVTLEYRLDKQGTRFLSAFHKRNNDHLLEGLVTETGGSFIIRRKLYRLGDLFDFLKKKKVADTLKEKEIIPDSSTGDPFEKKDSMSQKTVDSIPTPTNNNE